MTPASTNIDRLVRKWRADLYAIPELAFGEFRTQSYIANRLREMGIPSRRVGGTGLVVDFNSAVEGPCIAFRADMDALPFVEQLPWGSDGKARIVAKHACGHDMHSAILMGLARMLSEGQIQYKGCVRLIFQPAEEVLNTQSGASVLIGEGVLNSPHVERIYALHVSSRFAVGTIAYSEGVFMAESAKLCIELVGQGGHGASAADHDDPIMAAARVLTLLDGVRSQAPDKTAFSFCRVEGGSAPNVRPDLIRIEGTVRSHVEGGALRCAEYLREEVTRFGLGSPTLTFTTHVDRAYPILNNCREAVANLQILQQRANVKVLQIEPSWASEDFAVFLRERCGGMFLLGVNDGSLESSSTVHCRDFRGSDNALYVGVQCLAELVRVELGL